MIIDQPAQIMALLRAGKMINIGGRPVIVPRKPATPHDRGHAIKLALAFVAIYVIWGSTYLAIRYAVETIPPLVTAGIRHTVAGGIMLIWAWMRGFRPTRQQWISGLVVGALFFLVGHGTLHWAEQYVGSGLAALLIATEPCLSSCWAG
jgi:drug/metabolite transporter (DMT)-like permease